MTKRADIRGFGSTVRYNATPHYRLLGSLHVIEIFKKLAAENRGEIPLLMIPPSVKHRFSKMRRRVLFFQLVVLLHRNKHKMNSFWAHRMFETSSHKVSSILSSSEAEIWINCPPKVTSQFPTTRWQRAGICVFDSVVTVQCHDTLLASGLPACITNLHTSWRWKKTW